MVQIGERSAGGHELQHTLTYLAQPTHGSYFDLGRKRSKKRARVVKRFSVAQQHLLQGSGDMLLRTLICTIEFTKSSEGTNKTQQAKTLNLKFAMCAQAKTFITVFSSSFFGMEGVGLVPQMSPSFWVIPKNKSLSSKGLLEA